MIKKIFKNKNNVLKRKKDIEKWKKDHYEIKEYLFKIKKYLMDNSEEKIEINLKKLQKCIIEHFIDEEATLNKVKRSINIKNEEHKVIFYEIKNFERDIQFKKDITKFLSKYINDKRKYDYYFEKDLEYIINRFFTRMFYEESQLYILLDN